MTFDDDDDDDDDADEDADAEFVEVCRAFFKPIPREPTSLNPDYCHAARIHERSPATCFLLKGPETCHFPGVREYVKNIVNLQHTNNNIRIRITNTMSHHNKNESNHEYDLIQSRQ